MACTCFLKIGILALLLAIGFQQTYCNSEMEETSINSLQCPSLPSNVCCRIINGKKSSKKYPWMVSLHKYTKYRSVEPKESKLYESFFCAGSLINNQWILTAAHCLKDTVIDKNTGRDVLKKRTRDEILISFGDVNLKVDPSDVKIHKVKRVEVHEKYREKTNEYDIGLLKMTCPVTCSENIKPIRLPKQSFNEEGKDFTVAGWGITEQSGQVSQVLMEVTIPHVPRVECQKSYSPLNITERMICAGKTEGDKCMDSNIGDSGGGLVYNTNKNKAILAGIVSFGYKYDYDSPNGGLNSPGVYTRVNQFLPFIESITTKCDLFDKISRFFKC